MALPKQLLVSPARILTSDLGNTIPAKLGALESALCDIFGFTANTDVTASPFSCDNSGHLTKALIQQKAAGPVGWRFRNSTNNNEMRVAIVGTNLDFDENTGSEGSPSWTNRFRIAIATGALTGAVFTTARAGLAPASDGSATKYLSADGTYTIPAAVSQVSCRVRATSTQSLTTATFVPITFDTEDWDTGSMHDPGNPTRINFPSTGKYLLVGQCGFSANATGRRIVEIKLNSSGYPHGRNEASPTSSVEMFVTATALVNITGSDFATLRAYQTSGTTLTTVYEPVFSPQFAAYKIGS